MSWLRFRSAARTVAMAKTACAFRFIAFERPVTRELVVVCCLVNSRREEQLAARLGKLRDVVEQLLSVRPE
jgi:hypothetical protein